MKNRKITTSKTKSKIVLFIVLILSLSQTFAGYEIIKHTINNGGSTMIGGNYKMTSSVAQVDAGKAVSGANFSINSGFWHPVNNTPQPELIFNNGFE